MNAFISIINIMAPLLLITVGALISEYAGRLAMFMECIISLGGFLCYCFTIATKNAFLGVLISTLISTGLTVGIERISTRLKANMFLSSLSMNMIFAALTTLLSSVIFGTRGVLYSEGFSFPQTSTRTVTSIICFAVSALLIAFLKLTGPGLKLRITGSDPDVLESRGVSPDRYRCISWILAAACGSLAGGFYTLRLSSYVPGMSGGRGWTALAAVFLGRKHPAFVVVAVTVFAAADFASSNIQNIPGLSSLPSSILLALPYIVSIILIIAVPQKKDILQK
ncbi:MAG: ABC transporter permease [Treponema sp.]|nr:ABC transporter permease [Treponema sp.]